MKVAFVIWHEDPQLTGACLLVEVDFIMVGHLADVLVLIKEHVLVPTDLFEKDLQDPTLVVTRHWVQFCLL